PVAADDDQEWEGFMPARRSTDRASSDRHCDEHLARVAPRRSRRSGEKSACPTAARPEVCRSGAVPRGGADQPDPLVVADRLGAVGHGLAAFVDAALTGRRPETHVEDNVKSLALTLAIKESARTGRAVRPADLASFL